MVKKKKKAAKTKIDYASLTSPAIFIFILFIYLLTLAPTIGFRDSGDMVTASYLLGISHPSGFPLYMLVGKVFSFLPVSEIAFRYNLMSALFGALAVLLVYLSVNRLLKSVFAAAGISLMLAFSVTFWVYSNFAEKYSLYAFFAALLIWLAVNIKEKTIPLIVFILGLALTHHLALVAFILPVGLLVCFTAGKSYSIKKGLLLSLFFLLPLLLYLYLPLRASATPLKWDTPDTFLKIINHVSAKDYRYAMFSAAPITMFEKVYLHLIKNYINEFTVAGLLLILLGLCNMYKENIKAGLFLLGVIGTNTFLFVNYNIVDPQNIAAYYFASFVSAAVIMAFGLKWFADNIGKYKKYTYAGFFVFALSFIPGNYRIVDMKSYTADYEFGKNILKTVEKNSLVIVNGDLPIFSLWYLEYAGGYDHNIEIAAGNRLELSGFIRENYGKKKIYLNYFPFESVSWKDFEIIPFGMMYRPEKKGAASLYDKAKVSALWSSYRGLNGSNMNKNSPGCEREKMTLDHYAWALTFQGEFYLKNLFYEDALKMFEKALSIYPQYKEALIGMGRLAEITGKNDILAKKYYDKVLIQSNCLPGKNAKDSRVKVAELLKKISIMFTSAGNADKASYFLMKKNALENTR
ncbi:MAG: DUF2723 domain-containing protein [Candidatus Firestonebacteria bacterium]